MRDLRRGRAGPGCERSEGGYDAIMVDAYRQPYIPFYLATREFFELARERLAPGGVVIVNVGHPEGARGARAGAGADDGGGLPAGAALPDRGRPTRCWSAGEGAFSAARLRANLGIAAGGAATAGARGRPRRWRRACPAARSTPTTAPRSSGWSTPPCWNTRMSERMRLERLQRLAGDRPARARPLLRDRLRGRALRTMLAQRRVSLGSAVPMETDPHRAARLARRGRGRGSGRGRRARHLPRRPRDGEGDAHARLPRGQGAALAGDPAARLRPGAAGGDPRGAARVVRTGAARRRRQPDRRPEHRDGLDARGRGRAARVQVRGRRAAARRSSASTRASRSARTRTRSPTRSSTPRSSGSARASPGWSRSSARPPRATRC